MRWKGVGSSAVMANITQVRETPSPLPWYDRESRECGFTACVPFIRPMNRRAHQYKGAGGER